LEVELDFNNYGLSVECKEILKKCSDILHAKIRNNEVVKNLVVDLIKGAINGSEIDINNSESCLQWLNGRFAYQLTWLDQHDYARALVRALWLAPRFAATDFGGARQRDFAQVWTDTARGFLGEIAFQRFLQEKFGMEVKLDVKRGALEQFLPSDIKIRDAVSGKFRTPKKPLSIKTTKFNGRWLDLPGAQFDHSQVFVLIKLGISRFHFAAFLKVISFLKDKLFALAKDLGELDDGKAQELWKETPDFTSIPAYIAGYLEKEGLSLPIHQIICRKKGRRNVRVAISGGIGLFSLSTVRRHPEVKRIDPDGKLPVVVEPIIKSLTESKHFLAHSGALKFGKENWNNIVTRL
jgi:hypothetical protein